MPQNDPRLLSERVTDARSVTVNLAESPLGWLVARGLLSRRQFDAGDGCAAIGSAPSWRRA